LTFRHFIVLNLNIQDILPKKNNKEQVIEDIFSYKENMLFGKGNMTHCAALCIYFKKSGEIQNKDTVLRYIQHTLIHSCFWNQYY